MSAPTDRRFHLLDDLPSGRLAIQASAGTGKTYALAALATRFVAEQGVSPSELLIVTFTRAATSELRARVRERLVQAAGHLRADPSPPTDDELLVHLASADRAERLARLDRAIRDFDAATITTIHGFATQVLGTLGTAAGTDPDATLVDDSAELAAECCADVLAAAAAEHPAELLPNFEPLVKATRNAINIADIVLVPDAGQPGAAESDLVLADLVRRSIDAMRMRRRTAGTLSFDDILVELRRALDGAGRRAALDTLRERFKVALIDEFQDTDPVQWDIFRTLFGGGDTATSLVLVGDPKQAIYAFRGANVHTYLDAVSVGVDQRSLDTNWRSDGVVIEATGTLLAGTTFGKDEIAFVPVGAAPKNQARRLRTHTGAALPALSLRLALGDDLGRNKKKPCDISSGDADKAIYGDLVAQVRELLDSALIPSAEEPEQSRPVRPSDIAVLVKSGSEAEAVQDALKRQGVPAVLARGASVLESPAAEQWRWLLEGLLRPSDPARARTFAVSWFGGRSADWVHGAGDDELGEVQELLHDWASVLTDRGVTELVRRVWAESGVVARVLARPDGDREMTDLDHLAELLQADSPVDRSSAAGLLAVLDRPKPIEVDADVDRDVASRRVESEAAAVQVMTVWVAKGLEFPIVCCPTMWRRRHPAQFVHIYQDPDTDERTYDLSKGGAWPDKAGGAERKALAEAEAAGEDLRLLYVALTRAKHQTVLWWSRCQGSDTTALARVLFARTDGVIDPERFAQRKVPLPDDLEALDTLAPLVAASNGTIALGVHGYVGVPPTPWTDPEAHRTPADLELAELGPLPDRSRYRWSFTAITNRARVEHADPYDASLSDTGADDEATVDEPGDPADVVVPDAPATDAPATDAPATDTPAADLTGGLAMLPAGATFGTLVHSVLEEVDFADPDLEASIAHHLDRQLSWRALDLTPVGVEGATAGDGRSRLIAGLRAAIETPLGSALGEVRLRDISRSDRLDELSFELLLGESGHRPSDGEVGRLVERHLAPTDLLTTEPLMDWAGQLAKGLFSVDLAGHLTGSIDAVLRIHRPDGTPEFFVVDYKTNRLTDRGRTPTADDYRPDRLVGAMGEHHYPLQALLYSVALHRYLRWRLPGYRPTEHLGGAAYLFLRGMTGEVVPRTDGQPHGVFSWRIPPALVTDLSDLLDGRSVDGVT